MASLLKTAVIATTAALVATVASLTLSTTAPTPAHADIPPTVLAQNTPPGQVPSLAPMLKTVLPAIVNISVTSKVEIQNPLMNDPFFRRFFNVPDQQQPQTQEAQAIGSGVIVDADKGYVVTNNHVIDQADSIKVRLSDDREVSAKLIGKDPQTDLAVLQIKAANLKALPLGDSDKTEVGDFVVAIGSPFGLQQTVTSGIVSALGRNNLGDGDGDGVEDFIQTDASINPGNSGGGLVNLRGELIGINSQILSRSGGSMGIGFAIPSSIVKSVMTQLIESGSVSRGRIGLTGQPLTPSLAKAFNLADGHGVLVTQVVPDSPADKAGIKVQDIVVQANGREVSDIRQLRTMVQLLRIGDKVDLKILRDGKEREVTVAVGKADDKEKVESERLHPALKGATFGAITDPGKAGTAKGVQVLTIDPRSPAARSGLRPGDVIVGVNRQPVRTVSEFEKLASNKDDQLLLQVQRGSNAFFIVLDPS
jgi:Do/DeqQ family serine protease